MGDRANVVVQEEDGGKIFLYTHWGGYRLPEVLQSALKRGRNRWNDDAYLTRIIFCEMVKGSEMEETGYGISTYECDNEHEHLVVDIKTQQVICGEKNWGFQEFVDAVDPIPDF